MQAGGHRFDPVHLHQYQFELNSAFRCAVQFDHLVGCRSLKNHRVELALLVESSARASIETEALKSTVPPAANRLRHKLLIERYEERHSAKYSNVSLTDLASAGVKVIGSSE